MSQVPAKVPAKVGEKTVDDTIRKELDRLLDRPIADEGKVLEIIVQAITNKYAQPELVERAVHQAIHNYETQIRIFQIATAKRQLARIVRLMEMTEQLEDLALSPTMVSRMDPKDLIALYGKAQNSVKEGLDYIKNVVDMRVEAAKAQAALVAPLESHDPAVSTGIQSLSSQQRDKVRRIIDGIVEDIGSINAGEAKIGEESEEPEEAVVVLGGNGGNGKPIVP
jgi:hypothetical protein